MFLIKSFLFIIVLIIVFKELVNKLEPKKDESYQLNNDNFIISDEAEDRKNKEKMIKENKNLIKIILIVLSIVIFLVLMNVYKNRKQEKELYNSIITSSEAKDFIKTKDLIEKYKKKYSVYSNYNNVLEIEKINDEDEKKYQELELFENIKKNKEDLNSELGLKNIKEFKKLYPDSKYLDEIDKIQNILDEEKLYKEIQKDEKYSIFQSLKYDINKFRKRYPNSKYNKDIDVIEQRAKEKEKKYNLEKKKEEKLNKKINKKLNEKSNNDFVNKFKNSFSEYDIYATENDIKLISKYNSQIIEISVENSNSLAISKLNSNIQRLKNLGYTQVSSRNNTIVLYKDGDFILMTAIEKVVQIVYATSKNELQQGTMDGIRVLDYIIKNK